MEISNRIGDRATQVRAKELWREKTPKGKWVDWVMRVKFNMDNKGYIKIWRNGIKVTDISGVQTVYRGLDPESRAPLYMALSLYKPKYVKLPTNAKSRTFYYDEFRVAEGADGANLVRPGRSR